MTRIDDKFAALRAEGKKAFVAYLMAGDPDAATSMEVMKGLPDAGVDIIELGVPFTDPMADGPTIQLAGQRALEGGMTLQKTLDMAAEFRKGDDTTPIVLMGYYNPIYNRGVARFLEDAKAAGVDGLIVVDLPPEEDAKIPRVCHSLDMALEALDQDREFLLKGGVFTNDLIDAYIELKMAEVTRFRMTTHPVEFQLYYSC